MSEYQDKLPERVSSSENNQAQNHVIILVHGIRDYAIWQEVIRKELSRHFVVESTNYGRFDLIRFLFPFGFFRNKAIEEVYNQILDSMSLYPGARFSIIAHSFGTYVIAKIIQSRVNFTIHRVIFCGSILPYNFQFEHISHRFTTPVINEVGNRDFWPAVAESVTWGYGSAGTYGFRRPRVRDRWHAKAGHGYFLNARFCNRYWVPFLREGTIVEGALPESAPLWIRLISIFPLKYLAPALIAIVLVLQIPPQPSPPQPDRPVNGKWDVVMKCPAEGGVIKEFLKEYNVIFNNGQLRRNFTHNGDVGKTAISMGYTSGDGIQVRGYVMFAPASWRLLFRLGNVYQVVGEARKDGGSYIGRGSYGFGDDCILTAVNKD
jgi:hypothetical protein